MALLHKKNGVRSKYNRQSRKVLSGGEKCKGLNKEQKAAAEDFFSHVNIAYDEKRIDVRGDNLYYLTSTKIRWTRITFP